MQWRPWGTRVCAVCGAVAAWAPATAGGQSAISIGPNVHVSRARAGFAHAEVQLVADPVDAGRLIACAMVFVPEANAFHTVVYASADTGRSWAPTLEVDRGLTIFDPTCEAGQGGVAYFSAFGWRAHPGGAYEALVYRSADGGRTWAQPVGVQVLDRPYLTADRTDGPRRGRLYLHGSGYTRTADGGQVGGLTLLRSGDGGATFAPPVTLPAVDGQHVQGVGNGVVLSDGTLLIPFMQIHAPPAGGDPARTRGTLKVVAATDGGERFGRPAVVSEGGVQRADREGTWLLATTPALAADVGRGPFHDRVYAAWPDARGGRTEILFAYSADRGKTWSQPITVSDDRVRDDGGPDHFMPTVAVNAAGVVGVAWYDRRESRDGRSWRVRFAASLDGGETFTPSVAVAEAAYDVARLVRVPLWSRVIGGGSRWEDERGGPLRAEMGVSRFHYNGGDTAGLVADATGVFHALWVDTRTGGPQVWTAPVRVAGSAVRHGDSALAAYDDVTEWVALDLTNVTYDGARQVVTAELAVVNTSPETIRGRLAVRVLGVHSPLGVATVRGADNGRQAAGAVWHLGSLAPGDSLLPGAASRPRRVEFGLAGARPPDPRLGAWGISPVVELRSRVLRAPSAMHGPAGTR